jgi:hypothetical protein
MLISLFDIKYPKIKNGKNTIVLDNAKRFPIKSK